MEEDNYAQGPTAELQWEIEEPDKLEQGVRRKRRKHLAARLIDLLEKERRELACMLRDEIAQILASVKIDLECQLEQKPALESVQSAKEKTLDALGRIKNISEKLRPGCLDFFGLIPAVRILVEGTKEYACFKIRFHAKDLPEKLEPEKELALYRIIQEALTNAAKHSGAGRVFVNLIRRNAGIVLTVEDDGRGFDWSRSGEAHPPRENAMGIAIMRVRALQCGGSFRIESQPGRGTQVMVEIPVLSPPSTRPRHCW